MFKKISAAFVSVVLTVSASQAATFNGQTVTLFQYFENTTFSGAPEDQIFVTGFGQYQAGAGIVLNDDPNLNFDAPFYFVDLVGDSITIDLFDSGFGSDGTTAARFAQNRGRNGLVLQDTLDVLPDFTTLNLLSNTFSGTPSVSVSANELIFDFNGAGDDGGAFATWDVQAVPLPATLPMMLAGFGLFAWIRRRQSVA